MTPGLIGHPRAQAASLLYGKHVPVLRHGVLADNQRAPPSTSPPLCQPRVDTHRPEHECGGSGMDEFGESKRWRADNSGSQIQFEGIWLSAFY